MTGTWTHHYKLYYHMSPEGHIWLDAKNHPIPLNSQLVGHIESIKPHIYWQSRVTQTGIHSSVTLPQRGGAVIVLSSLNTLLSIPHPLVPFKMNLECWIISGLGLSI